MVQTDEGEGRMSKCIKESHINILFKMVYLIHLFLSMIVYTAGNKISLILLLICGVIIGIYRIIHIKDYLKFQNVFIMLAFLVSYIIPNIVFIKYGITEQAQMFVWMVFQFFLVYTFNIENKISDIYKEMKILFYTIILLSTIASSVSLGMMFANYSTVVTSIGGNTFLTGLTKWGRLYGVYNEVNYASVFTIVSIFLAHMFLKQTNKKFSKVCLISSNVIQILYIVFGQSRTAQVCIIMAAVVLLICKTLENVNKKYILKNSITALLIIVISFWGFPKVVSLYNIIDFDTFSGSANIDKKEDDDKIEMGREDLESGDISNRRFDIWASSLDFIKDEPIFGIGNRNIIAYAQENIPDSYMITNDLFDFDAFHNTLIDIVVSQGVIGLLIALVLVYRVLKYVVARWKFLDEKERYVCNYLLSIEIMIAGSAMFLSHVFYVNILTTYCFWLLLGYLIVILSKASNNVDERVVDVN